MKKIPLLTISFLLIIAACQNNTTAISQQIDAKQAQTVAVEETISGTASFALKLSAAALSLTKDKVEYDPAYFSIKYPNGDVPADKGVCTDVVSFGLIENSELICKKRFMRIWQRISVFILKYGA